MIEGMHDMDMDTGVEDASLARLARIRTKLLGRLEEPRRQPHGHPPECRLGGSSPSPS